MAGHNILKLESDLKDQLSIDKSDPITYYRLKWLIEGILVVKKLAYNSTEVDGISHEMATDFYLRLNDPNKNFELYAPTKYIMRSIKRYISDYLYYNYDKQEVDVSDPVVKNDFIKNMFPHVSDFTTKGSLEDIIKMIPGLIQKSYDKYIRYYKDSDEYKSTLISLYMSIYNQDIIIYDEYTDSSLLLFMYRLVINNIIKYVDNNIKDSDRSYYELDSIKVFEMSVDGG